MTSATDELRKLLDERGIEYETWNDYITVAPPSTHYLEVSNGTLCVAIVDCTPEQAIAATLKTGECVLTMDGTNGCFGCSECLENIPPLANYCPNCGRKVKR